MRLTFANLSDRTASGPTSIIILVTNKIETSQSPTMGGFFVPLALIRTILRIIEDIHGTQPGISLIESV